MNERRGTLEYRVAWEAKGEGGKGRGTWALMIMSVWFLCSLCCAPDARSLRLFGHESTLLSSWCRVWHARRRGFGLLGGGMRRCVGIAPHGQTIALSCYEPPRLWHTCRTPLNGLPRLDKSEVPAAHEALISSYERCVSREHCSLAVCRPFRCRRREKFLNCTRVNPRFNGPPLASMRRNIGIVSHLLCLLGSTTSFS